MSGTIIGGTAGRARGPGRFSRGAATAAESSADNSDDAGVPQLDELFSQNRGPILGTYSLFVFENLFRLAQPFALGWAINDLLAGRMMGLWVLVAQHVLFMTFGLWRQVVDTRVFSRIYSRLATSLIVDQRKQGVEESRIAARSALSREYVDFFEKTIPTSVQVAFSVVGSLIMLGFYDWVVVLLCIGLLGPAAWLNRIFARKTRQLSRKLHDQLENEFDVIRNADKGGVEEHFSKVAGWRVRLSNAEALNFGAMEAFVLGVIILALIRTCGLPFVEAGDIFAVFRYLMVLLMGVDQIPRVVMQLSRMRDVDDRIRNVAE
ncbi:MAG: ABC transporter six-transmembrane domain-containing protein [Planctomycetota bacterium]|nr:ABC transporter six-transmembrane domain-containing protein [Planctomycetota bacterium]MDA1249732.1 ABC transporter six-transmembrane domain-containing protein [Planctomycetota bacterium]